MPSFSLSLTYLGVLPITSVHSLHSIVVALRAYRDVPSSPRPSPQSHLPSVRQSMPGLSIASLTYLPGVQIARHGGGGVGLVAVASSASLPPPSSASSVSHAPSSAPAPLMLLLLVLLE